MPFTSALFQKSSIGAPKKIAALFLVLLISACSSLEKKDKDSETKPSDVAAEGEGLPFVLIPSPYAPRSIPAPAKQAFDQIVALINAKDWQQAKEKLDAMIKTYPTLSGPYVNLGIVYFRLGEFENAEKALNFAIETNPQNFDAYTSLGLLLREQGRFAEAEQTYLKALQLWPHHLASVLNLGILYDLYMGRFKDALTYYELAQQISGGEDRKLKGWIADTKRRINEE